MSKGNEIKQEKSRLFEIFKDIDENKLLIVNTLIDRLAWLNVSIKEIEKNIDEQGTTIEYRNSETQWGVKDNPNIKTHIQYTKNIAMITKQLIELVPPSKKKSKLDELMNE